MTVNEFVDEILRLDAVYDDPHSVGQRADDAQASLALRAAKLANALRVSMDFVERYAGPRGAGCSPGSMQHFAQTVRDKVERLVNER